MKKLTLITGIIIMIAFLAGTVNAQSTQSDEKATLAQTDQKTSSNFIDKNGDGVCDNNPDCCKNGKSTKFVDENGDGICDNCKGKENCGQGNCCGKEMKKGECTTKAKANCCSKDKGHKSCNQKKSGDKAKSTEPEKK